MSETKIQIFDRSRQTVPEMRMKIRKLMSEHKGLKPLILIDYLTLIHSDENKHNMHLQVSAITKDLKAVAREFNCPVITLAQLNRGVEQRQDKRPMMSDLRESGSIEEDADVIVFYTAMRITQKMTMTIGWNSLLRKIGMVQSEPQSRVTTNLPGRF